MLADSGEDLIAYCPDSDYAANVELAEALAPATPRAAPQETLREVDTPKQTTCEDVAALLDIPLTRTVKLIAGMVNNGAGEQMVVLLLRGDHMLNEVKLGKLEGLPISGWRTKPKFARPSTARPVSWGRSGSIAPKYASSPTARWRR